MAEGLKPHYHQYYTLKVIRYYDKKKHYMSKVITFRCMICGKEYYERYEYKPPPKRRKSRRKKNEKGKIN